MYRLKKRLLVPVALWGCLFAKAQTDSTTTRRTNHTKDANAVEIKGTVTDAASHQPLRAISVTYQSYSAAITDSLGRFTLKVPNAAVTIVLQAEGFQTKEVSLRGRRTITAALYEDSYTSFYDAAALPYGTQTINRIPYAVSLVQATNNWAHAAEVPDAYIQGRVAGLNAVRRAGTPNSGANLFLRGLTSLYATAQPLVVIDNVIYDMADYGGSLIANNYTNPLAYIDVKDIDNITVIKDGLSTYGTKGANGVIVITTARAKELATRIDAAVYGGVNAGRKDCR